MILGTDGDGGSARGLCMTLPGNLAREVAVLRSRLFSLLGVPSARAFPAVVVLAWLEPHDAARASPLRSPRRVTLGGPLTCDDRDIFLSASGLEAFADAALGASDLPGPFAARRGIFLARAEDGQAAVRAAETPVPATGSFLARNVSILSLRFSGPDFRASSWRVETPRPGRGEVPV